MSTLAVLSESPPANREGPPELSVMRPPLRAVSRALCASSVLFAVSAARSQSETPRQTGSIRTVNATLTYSFTITGGDQPAHATGTIGPVACTGGGLDPTMLWGPSVEGLEAFRTIIIAGEEYQHKVGEAKVGAVIDVMITGAGPHVVQAELLPLFHLEDGASASGQIALKLDMKVLPDMEWPPPNLNGRPNCSIRVLRPGQNVLGDASGAE